MRLKTYLQTLSFVLISYNFYAIEFEIDFDFDKEAKKQDSALKKKCELSFAKNHTFNSIFALKNQAILDAKAQEDFLKEQGYLDAQVIAYVDTQNEVCSIIFEYRSGKRYKIGKVLFDPPLSVNLAIPQNEYLTFSLVEELETKLVETYQEEGFFQTDLNEIKIIPQNDLTADLKLSYDPNERYLFGSTSIKGQKRVKQSFIMKKIPWKKGDVFKASYLKEVQKRLLETELFSQVTVKPGEPVSGYIPINIEVQESKFKSISLGVNYQTHFGAGGDLSFENKNLGGEGQIIALETSITQNSLLGKIDYAIPHLHKDNQSLGIRMEASREQLQPSFTDNMYELALKFDKAPSTRISYEVGFASRYYVVQHSLQNGPYAVLFPYFRWRFDNTYSQLDPKNGIKTTFSAFYYQNINHPKQFYSSTFKIAGFYSIFKKRLTFAERIYLGNLYSSKFYDVPIPLRFFGGTDEYLRGYKYYTVSPLVDGKPIGGLSCLFFNTELRLHVKDPFGIVFFYDSGFVSMKSWPTYQSPYYQTAGFGFRYYAFFGPLRIDFGFPLKIRKNLDDKFKILASFGHTF